MSVCSGKQVWGRFLEHIRNFFQQPKKLRVIRTVTDKLTCGWGSAIHDRFGGNGCLIFILFTSLLPVERHYSIMAFLHSTMKMLERFSVSFKSVTRENISPELFFRVGILSICK